MMERMFLFIIILFFVWLSVGKCMVKNYDEELFYPMVE
ncbi:hypothetical protein PORCRE_854 [Porphyromonas crevioricanis JCM 15906]|uniref:Uncharacterized protein n=1 Tax=Porphyromonas crevioricanis JCM 15906 TaxID=1305617 RepID=T1DS79_9PORP|nr:hypothetical protein PORCRE_854 [Porphyromonas crevioricanis JCM 15906]